jgi:hypothetical protein
MKTKIVTVNIAKYYIKYATVELEVPVDLVGDALVEFLTEDDDVNERYENYIDNARLHGDESHYEWADPTDNNGGHL